MHRLLIIPTLLICVHRADAQQPPPVTGAAAFLIESAGGTIGSAAGFGFALATFKDCGTDDLRCDITSAVGAMAIATVGSATGAYLAGKLGNTRPSGLGVAIGSIAGAAAGAGAWHFVNEELNLATSDVTSVAVYAVTQGIVTAIGSRIVTALRK